MTETLAKVQKLSRRDVIKAWAKYYTCAEVSSGFERLTALAFSFGMNNVLYKLYKDQPEEYRKALQRHLVFYNSEATWGSVIIGITCALEEERAIMMQNGASQEQLDQAAEMITNVKVGLMGPLAGIGDTVNHGLLRPLLLSLFIPLAEAGSWAASPAPLIIWGIGITFLAYTLVTRGYTLGRKYVTAMLQSGRLNSIIQMASVLGLFMMGALSSTYVKLNLAVSWVNAAEETVTLQSYFDKLFPNLLPLAVVFGIYFYIRKVGPKYVRLLLVIIGASLLLSFLGIV